MKIFFFSSITKTASLLNVVTHETDCQECPDPSCPDEVQRNWLSGVFRPQLSWWSPKKLVVRSVQAPAVLMKSKETGCQECSDPSCPDEVQRYWLSGVFRPKLSWWSPKKLIVRSVQTPAARMKSKETGKIHFPNLLLTLNPEPHLEWCIICGEADYPIQHTG